MLAKSGIMVGLGESTDELLSVFDELRQVGCDILTVGQYLRPTRRHLPVVRYYHPEIHCSQGSRVCRGFRWWKPRPRPKLLPRRPAGSHPERRTQR